jgi:UDP-N-acetylglucosamine:LPS N-acetylglucosamine transferase
MSVTASLQALREAHTVLDHLTVDPSNLDKRDEEDFRRYYDAVVSETPVSSPKLAKIVDQLNGLECEGFIPSKTAIFLKNNLHDSVFVASLLTKLVINLHENKIINSTVKAHLLSKIDSGEFSDVVQFLYACMLIPDEDKSMAQDELTLYSEGELSKYVEHREQLRSREYLKSKLLHLGGKLSAEDRERYVAPLIEAINANNPKQFKADFLVFVHFLAGKQDNEIQKYCFEDILETFKGVPEKGFFRAAHQAFRTQDFYGSYVARVRDLTRSLQTADLASQDAHELTHLFEKCQRAFHNTVCALADFKNMPCASKTAYCLVYGQLSGEWLKVNQLFQAHKHALCRCHASGHAKPVWPLYKPDFFFNLSPSSSPRDMGESVAIIGCDWGNGHRAAAQNTARIYEKMGYHPVSVNLPTEVLADEDPVRKVLGWASPVCNVGWLVNGLARNGAFRVYNMLRGNPKPADPSPETVKKVVQHLLKINPSMIVSTYSAHNESLIRAGEILGRPVMHINTDVDAKIETRDKPPTYPHFKMAIAFPDKDQVEQLVDRTVTREQLVVSGPPVKEIDDQDRTLEDVHRMKDKWGIPRNKKLVFVTSGGNGGNSPYVEMLVKKYAGKKPEEIPFHLVVLCGRDNAKFRDYITTKLCPKTGIKIDAYTSVPPEDMEELMTMASYGGCVIGKAGGMTLFELTKRGARILIDDMPSGLLSGSVGHFFLGLLDRILGLFGVKSKLPWEAVNQKFACDQGLAQIIHNENEFNAAFDQALSHSEPVKLTVDAPKFNEVMPGIITEMQEKARRDRELSRRHIEVLDTRELLI